MSSFIPSVHARVVRRFLAVGAVVSSFMCASRPDAAAQAIVAIGDSITSGGYGNWNDAGEVRYFASYRSPLIELLRGANILGANPSNTVYDFNMVGSLSTTLGGYPVNGVGNSLHHAPAHEGHFGWTTAEVSAGLPTWLTGYSANVALVHLGTNDARLGSSLLETATAFTRILTNLWNDGVSDVFIAKIGHVDGSAYGNNSAYNSRIDAINGMIGSGFAGLVPDGRRVHIVDLTSMNPDTMLLDYFHPNPDGERYIASQFFTAMNNAGVLSAIPEPSTYAAILGVVALGGTMVVRRRRKATERAV
jgi:hypothetical protein